MHSHSLLMLMLTLLPVAGTVATISVSVLKGYTTPLGNNAGSVADATIVSASNAYTYPAGGFALSNQSFGLRGFDYGGGMISQGGTYYGVIQVKATTPVAGLKPKTAYLRLFVCATGAEVSTGAAINADVVRFFVMGG